MALNSLLRWIRKGQDTLSIQLDITNACNLRCTHCYHQNHQNAGAIDLSDWQEILNQYEALLEELRLKPSVVICGGEPMLSPNLIPIGEIIARKWPDALISVLTNGTLITTGNIETLSRFNVDFQVSIDGHDNRTHDAVRGEGTFEKALEGISALRTANLHVNLLAVLSRRTAPHIADFFSLAKRLQVRRMSFTRMIPQGSARLLRDSGADSPLSGLELKAAMELIIATSKVSGVRTSTYGPLYVALDEGLGYSGQFGFQGLVVDYRGNLKVSSRSNFLLGNIREHGLRKLFLEHPLMCDLRSGKIEICGSCRHFTRCGGDRNAAYSEYGSFLAPDPGCWLIEKNLESHETQKKENRYA